MLKGIQNNLVAQLTGEAVSDIMPTANEFSIEVEAHAVGKQCDLMDSLTLLVAHHRLDEIDVPKLLTKALKEKIGIEVGIIKQGTKLPI